MNRRTFLARSAAVLPFTHLARQTRLQFPPLEESKRPGWHRLGPTPTGESQVVAAQLSDDVFARLLAAREWGALRVVTAERVGDGRPISERVGVIIDYQYNTSVEYSTAALIRDGFDIKRFRDYTNVWMIGAHMAPGSGDPARLAFDKFFCVGFPMLPAGLMWAAHYCDEHTGLVMRALAQYEVYPDHAVFRWDVIGAKR